MDLLISFVNQTFTPEYALGILRNNGQFFWIKGDASLISKGITGLFYYNNRVYVAFQENGLGVMDQSFNLIQHYKSDNIKDPHSICIYKNQLYVVSTGRNSIYRFTINAQGLIQDEALLWSVPGVDSNYDYVHLNSLVVSDRGIYATMFGERTKGQSWDEILNGKLICIDNNEVLLDNLKQPHSLLLNENSTLVLCESKTGSILTEHGETLKRLRGYTRGICKVNNIYIVAENARRKFSKSTLGDFNGRIREFEEHGLQHSQLNYLTSKKFKSVKNIKMSQYGNEMYDILPLEESFVNYKSYNIKPHLLEPRSKVLEDRLVEVLIRGEEKISESNKKIEEQNTFVESKLVELEKLRKSLEVEKKDNSNEYSKKLDLVNEDQIRIKKPEQDISINNYQSLLKEVKSEYKNMIDFLNASNTTYKNKLESTQHDLFKSEIQYHQKSFELKIIKNELDSLKGLNEKLINEVKIFNNEKSELINEKLEQEKQFYKLQDDIRNLSVKLEILVDEKSRLTTEIQTYKKKLREIEESREELNNSYKETILYVNSFVEENNKLKKQLDNNEGLKTIISNLENDLEEISFKLKSQYELNDELKENFSSKEKEFNDTLSRLHSESVKEKSELQIQIAKMEESKNHLSIKYEDTLNHVKSLLDQNNSLEKQLDDNEGLKTIISNLENDLEELSFKLKSQYELNDDLKEENNKLKTIHNQTSKTLTKSKNHVKSLKKKLRKRNSKIKHSNSKIKILLAEKKKLENQVKKNLKREIKLLNDAARDYNALERKYNSKAAKLNSLIVAYDELMNSYKANEDIILDLRSQKQNASNQLIELKKDHQIKLGELTRTHKEVVDLKASLEEINSQLTKLQKKYFVISQIENYNNNYIRSTRSQIKDQLIELNKKNNKLDTLNNTLTHLKEEECVLKDSFKSLKISLKEKNETIDQINSKMSQQKIILENKRFEINEKNKQILLLVNQNKNLKNSYSFKIGYKITRSIKKYLGWLPFIANKLEN